MRFRTALLACALLAGAVVFASPGQAATRTTGDHPAGVTGAWRRTFSEEFNGSRLDTTKWATTSSAESDGGAGNLGNQQLEWNQRQNCAVRAGALTITAHADSITSPSGHHYGWSSCLITSRPSYAFRYGFIEERAMFPSLRGFWPGFWTWQAAGNERWTETDAYENYSDNRTRLYLTQHSGARGGCNVRLPFDPASRMHVYGVDIERTGTDWYVDGAHVCHTHATTTGLTNIVDDMFVYAGVPPSRSSVGHKTVDYIRAWQH
jgi:beta-glucanase (GH16 family)